MGKARRINTGRCSGRKEREMEDNAIMSVTTIKSELRDIADRIPDSASYNDAMYQLYVRMKIAKGKQAADEGRVVPHEEVKRRFIK